MGSFQRRQDFFISLYVLIIFLAPFCLAQCPSYNLTGPFDHDPILQLQPEFARSMPVQILLTGVVLTLVGVLFVHLVFTGQYHWPLAPVNYILQVLGVSVLLVSLVATLRIILSTAMLDSQQWPYMLTYIAVDVPPQPDDSDTATEWSTPELVAWYIMVATVSGLVQITHIQFLTLLYPSRLEARLILSLLVPLAIVSAAMELFPVHQNQRVQDVAEVIRNTCNATLSLLFTAALFIWGFLVNRKQAWRTDGGTAAFGAGALFLTLMSSALNFLYIPSKDKYVWLPGLMWAVILWQNFLGWWWWVGGGMGVGEVEELLRREEKRQQKRKARTAKRLERRERAHSLWKSASETLRLTSVAVSSGRPVRRVSSSHSMADSTSSNPASIRTGNENLEEALQHNASVQGSSLSSLYTRIQSSMPARFLRRWYDVLRHSHLMAARVQALRRVQRRQEVYGAEANNVSENGVGAMGWGLGSFGIRELERQESQVEREDRESFELSRRDEAGYWESEQPVPTPTSSIPFSTPNRAHRSDSLLWWGPLRRWRLQDTTVY